MTSWKFSPLCDWDKQIIPWAASLRGMYGTTAQFDGSSTAHKLHIGIIIQSLEEGGKIWLASHVWRLFTNTLVYLHSRKNIIVQGIHAYHSQESQQPGKRSTHKEIPQIHSDSLPCCDGSGPIFLCTKRTVLAALFVTCIAPNICMKYMQLRSTHSRLCGRMNMALLKPRSTKLHSAPHNSAMNLELSQGQ